MCLFQVFLLCSSLFVLILFLFFFPSFYHLYIVVLHKLHNAFYPVDTTNFIILYFLKIEPRYNDIGLCHLVYSVTYCAVPINSLLLIVTLYNSVITTFECNDTKYSVRFLDVRTEFDWIYVHYIGVCNMLLAFCTFILAFMSKIKFCNSEER